MKQKSDEIPIKVGISSCLLGEKVRFDAGHKRDQFLTDVLGEYFVWLPVCPELEVGMGVPRESVRLVGSVDNPKMLGVKSEKDWTNQMQKYSEMRTKELEAMNLSGFIFKKDSPSCGMERVKIYSKKGSPNKNGIGIFAKSFMERFPLIPVEEEGRLNDFRLRENFIVRVFAYNRLLNLFENHFTRGALVEFHTKEKFQLLSHSQNHYRQLGQLVAGSKKLNPQTLRDKYSTLYMEALSVKTTTRKNVNVLQHILGYLRDHINSFERQSITNVIGDYQKELVPLIVPITLLRHYIEKHNIEYIKDQIYLNPHPKELMLRNHV